MIRPTHHYFPRRVFSSRQNVTIETTTLDQFTEKNLKISGISHSSRNFIIQDSKKNRDSQKYVIPNDILGAVKHADKGFKKK